MVGCMRTLTVWARQFFSLFTLTMIRHINPSRTMNSASSSWPWSFLFSLCSVLTGIHLNGVHHIHIANAQCVTNCAMTTDHNYYLPRITELIPMRDNKNRLNVADANVIRIEIQFLRAKTKTQKRTTHALRTYHNSLGLLWLGPQNAGTKSRRNSHKHENRFTDEPYRFWIRITRACLKRIWINDLGMIRE